MPISIALSSQILIWSSISDVNVDKKDLIKLILALAVMKGSLLDL